MADSVSGEVRGLIRDREEPFNILVVGHVGVGKSTLINSAHVAVAKKWTELAWCGGGGAGSNNTTFFMPYTMFKPATMTVPIDGYHETIKMWDFAGMENLAEETYIELIGLALEGRVPEKTSLMPLLKDTSLSPSALARRFDEIVQKQRFHRVIMVCDANRDLPENLVQTVKRATKTQDGRQIPIFVVFSMMDRVDDANSPQYIQRREEALKAFQLKGNLERFFETGLYSDCNPSCSRAPDKRFNRNDEIDNILLTMWRVLLNPAYDRSLRSLSARCGPLIPPSALSRRSPRSHGAFTALTALAPRSLGARFLIAILGALTAKVLSMFKTIAEVTARVALSPRCRRSHGAVGALNGALAALSALSRRSGQNEVAVRAR
ncbi:Hypp6005 [Branchiostoma lanceolatum]|uniref:Hypp6005 protein n=1 Tax=Branchiostoma lanceolatum TaxID=7740 RepID=A0A8J9YPQ8_BRALA|nr:Hypp6005 [Branchiostoma lanceolatum]